MLFRSLRSTSPSRRPLLLVVTADRLDHAAHAGNAAAAEHEMDDVAAAVHIAVAALARRADATVIVTGDHGTHFGSAQHSDEAVPLLIYGAGARAAAGPLAWPPAAGAAPPTIAATDLPAMFPYFRRDCSGQLVHRPAPGWLFLACGAAFVTAAAAVTHRDSPETRVRGYARGV